MSCYLSFVLVGSTYQAAGVVYLKADEISAIYPSPAGGEGFSVIKWCGECWAVIGDVTGVRDRVEEFLRGRQV